MSRENFAGDTSGQEQIFVVEKSYFATSVGYGDGTNLQLHWLGRVEGDIVREQTDPAEYHPSWSCGADWISVDGGKTASHPAGKTQFRKGVGSRPGAFIQEMIERAMEAVPEGGPEDIFGGKASALDATIWEGTKWLLADVEFDFGGEIGKRMKSMPKEYLGKVGAPAAPVAAPAAVPAAAPAATNGELRSQVVALAKTVADFPTFQAAALALPGVAIDTALLGEVIDESAGIWATKA